MAMAYDHIVAFYRAQMMSPNPVVPFNTAYDKVRYYRDAHTYAEKHVVAYFGK